MRGAASADVVVNPMQAPPRERLGPPRDAVDSRFRFFAGSLAPFDELDEIAQHAVLPLDEFRFRHEFLGLLSLVREVRAIQGCWGVGSSGRCELLAIGRAGVVGFHQRDAESLDRFDGDLGRFIERAHVIFRNDGRRRRARLPSYRPTSRAGL